MIDCVLLELVRLDWIDRLLERMRHQNLWERQLDNLVLLAPLAAPFGTHWTYNLLRRPCRCGFRLIFLLDAGDFDLLLVHLFHVSPCTFLLFA